MFMDYCTNLEIIVYICNSVGAFLESRCTFTSSTMRLVAKSRNLKDSCQLYTGFLYLWCVWGSGAQGAG